MRNIKRAPIAKSTNRLLESNPNTCITQPSNQPQLLLSPSVSTDILLTSVKKNISRVRAVGVLFALQLHLLWSGSQKLGSLWLLGLGYCGNELKLVLVFLEGIVAAYLVLSADPRRRVEADDREEGCNFKPADEQLLVRDQVSGKRATC